MPPSNLWRVRSLRKYIHSEEAREEKFSTGKVISRLKYSRIFGDDVKNVKLRKGREEEDREAPKRWNVASSLQRTRIWSPLNGISSWQRQGPLKIIY